jgi:thiol-disulfide isomerase/thioredoxin
MAPGSDRRDDPADDGGRADDEGLDPGPVPEDGAGGDDPEEAGAVPAEGGRAVPVRRMIDGRTLAVCALVALIAALVAGVAASRLTADDEEPGAPPTGALEEAAQAPDVTFERFDGSPVSLDDYRGQPLVVNFWGSWCAPCVEEMPDLERVHASLGDQVAFLGVNINDTPEAAEAMAARTGVTYDLARDPEGDLSRALDVVSWPTTVLVLPDGTIVDAIRREVSAERLCEKINQSLLAGALTECG